VTIEIGCVGDIEMPHKFRKISPRRFSQKMEMVTHQHIAVQDYIVYFYRLSKECEELLSICIIAEDCLPFIAPVSKMIYCTGILDAKRSGHKENYLKATSCVKDKDLTPMHSRIKICPLCTLINCNFLAHCGT